MHVIKGHELLNIEPGDVLETFNVEDPLQIIHQSWKDYSIPLKFKKWHESWKKYCPNAIMILWSDNDNFELIDRYYPQFLNVYMSLPLVIQKCDMVRLLYLHRYGGTYVDLDYEVFTDIYDTEEIKSSTDDILFVESQILLNDVVYKTL